MYICRNVRTLDVKIKSRSWNWREQIHVRNFVLHYM